MCKKSMLYFDVREVNSLKLMLFMGKKVEGGGVLVAAETFPY